MHASTLALLVYFDYEHLPAALATVSKPFHDLAHEIAETLPDNPEKTVALRKLLEAKDCAVRAALPAGRSHIPKEATA
jgi:ferritin-like protein